MKRTLLAGILGMAASLALVNNLQAEGRIIFNTYAEGSQYIRYSLNGGPLVNIPDTWHASIWYALGNVTGSVVGGAGSQNIPSGGGLTFYTGAGDVAPISSAFPGLINGDQIIIPGYTSGLATFVVGVFNGSDYFSSVLRGHSAAFTETLTTGFNVDVVFANFQGFDIIIPEPSTYALMGMGLMSLGLMRWRKRG